MHRCSMYNTKQQHVPAMYNAQRDRPTVNTKQPTKQPMSTLYDNTQPRDARSKLKLSGEVRSKCKNCQPCPVIVRSNARARPSHWSAEPWIPLFGATGSATNVKLVAGQPQQQQVETPFPVKPCFKRNTTSKEWTLSKRLEHRSTAARPMARAFPQALWLPALPPRAPSGIGESQA